MMVRGVIAAGRLIRTVCEGEREPVGLQRGDGVTRQQGEQHVSARTAANADATRQQYAGCGSRFTRPKIIQIAAQSAQMVKLCMAVD